MDGIIEVNEIDLNNSHSGGGLEFLMNDKVKTDGGNKNIYNSGGLDDIDNLEFELKELSDLPGLDTSVDDTHTFKSDLFSKSADPISNNAESEKFNVKFEDIPDIPLGKSTSDSNVNTKTWDGFDNFNNIPNNPDMSTAAPQMSKEELLREKFKYLRKLESLEKKGVELSKKYTMDSSLQEMQGEYETLMEEKSKSNSVKFQGNMLMACINGIEFLNGKFDPFDVKLDGWSEQINENLGDYDEIFGELYEKYKSKASMAPELKLLFQLGGSGMMIHMSNTLFKSAMPSMDDVFRQNPDLMKSFQSAAVNSMGNSNPGLAGFMNSVSGSFGQDLPNEFGKGPPPPMNTQGPGAQAPPTSRPGNNNTSYNVNDGINFKEKEDMINFQSSRTEMKGPSNLDDILSGLKTKNINIQSSNTNDRTNQESSTISINDLKSLNSENENLPKKSRRRNKSNNVVSLNI